MTRAPVRCAAYIHRENLRAAIREQRHAIAEGDAEHAMVLETEILHWRARVRGPVARRALLRGGGA